MPTSADNMRKQFLNNPVLRLLGTPATSTRTLGPIPSRRHACGTAHHGGEPHASGKDP